MRWQSPLGLILPPEASRSNSTLTTSPVFLPIFSRTSFFTTTKCLPEADGRRVPLNGTAAMVSLTLSRALIPVCLTRSRGIWAKVQVPTPSGRTKVVLKLHRDIKGGGRISPDNDSGASLNLLLSCLNRQGSARARVSLEELAGSPAYEIFNEVSRRKAAGEDMVSLAIGEPSFATPPEIIEAAYQSMKSGATHYVGSYGIPELRDAISQKTTEKNHIRANPGNTVFITTKLAVYACVMASGVAGGDVLIPDPGYYYSEPVIMNGGRPVRYPLGEDFAVDTEAIKKVATEKTRAIIINTPSNP